MKFTRARTLRTLTALVRRRLYSKQTHTHSPLISSPFRNPKHTHAAKNDRLWSLSYVRRASLGALHAKPKPRLRYVQAYNHVHRHMHLCVCIYVHARASSCACGCVRMCECKRCKRSYVHVRLRSIRVCARKPACACASACAHVNGNVVTLPEGFCAATLLHRERWQRNVLRFCSEIKW